MKTQNKLNLFSKICFLSIAFLILTTTSAHAAIMSSSSTAPVIDGYDIASYGTPTGADKWWVSEANAYGEAGKTVGQTFTTGNQEVLLEGFTFQIRELSQPAKTYTIRAGLISGSTFYEIASEIATQDFATASNDYWTWTLETPIRLSPNTVYGVDVGLNDSTSSWETGIPYIHFTSDVYSGGTRFRSGTEGYGVGDTSMGQMSGDRVFHIDLRYSDPNLPEVDAGSEWVTWSGQPVTLNPNVVDNNQDPQRSLTFEWTAEPADGVVFTPDASVEFPSVTITKPTDSPSPVKLTLSVKLNGDDPINDTTMVYVYDEACQATRLIGRTRVSAGDLDDNCLTDLKDFNTLAAGWLTGYGPAELTKLAQTWLEGDLLTTPDIVTVVVPNVTGISETEAYGFISGAGLTSSSTYQYDLTVPENEVISQIPAAGIIIPDDANVYLTVSLGLPPITEFAITNVYLAQTHVLSPNDPLFKLVGDRPALLKVQVVAPSGITAPPVTADISAGGNSTTLTLTGPAILPENFQSGVGLVQHTHDDSFTVLVGAEWIKPGLSITVNAGNATVSHNIDVGAPTIVKIKMFDIHYFGLGSADYPPGTFDELESKWPVSDLILDRIYNVNFPELVIPARGGAPYVKVSSKQDYYDQTGLNFDGEQAAALQWVHALSASGGNVDVAMQYINIIGVPAGGQAGGFDGVGTVSVGILNHELGHALSLPHWANNAAYPYVGPMYGIDPQPDNDYHAGPTWGFDIRSLTYLPPTVQGNSVGGYVGYYKMSPMQGGGKGDQEIGYLMRHFSDYGVKKMQNYLESKVAVRINNEYYKWNSSTGDHTTLMPGNGVNYPIAEDVQIYSVMASMSIADPNVNMIYTPIGPYLGNLINTFDPTVRNDRRDAVKYFAPANGCDFSLRIVQGGITKTYMLPASGIAGSNTSNSTLETAAINLPAADGTITQVELLLTPDAEDNGLPAYLQVLYTWTP